MAKKSWAAFAEERKAYPGEEMLVTRDTPDTHSTPNDWPISSSELSRSASWLRFGNSDPDTDLRVCGLLGPRHRVIDTQQPAW